MILASPQITLKYMKMCNYSYLVGEPIHPLLVEISRKSVSIPSLEGKRDQMPVVIAVQIQGKAQLQWRAQRSTMSKRWIGVCDAMNLVMEADTLDELYSVIDEAMQLMLSDLLRDNELEMFLREHGWHAPNVPLQVKPEDVKFNVPWELIAEGAKDDPERRPH